MVLWKAVRMLAIVTKKLHIVPLSIISFFIRASMSVDISHVVAVQSPAARFFFFLMLLLFFSLTRKRIMNWRQA